MKLPEGSKRVIHSSKARGILVLQNESPDLKKTCDLQVEKSPLALVEVDNPIAVGDEILIKTSCCGVCHTELDEIEGRTPPSEFPMILGHQVIGYVDATGENASRFKKGDRVGVAWIFSACGHCEFCIKGMENLCPEFKGTGRDARGGYAAYMKVHENLPMRFLKFFQMKKLLPCCVRVLSVIDPLC
jgi:propanol-preferring alcohol dehydrogenase